MRFVYTFYLSDIKIHSLPFFCEEGIGALCLKFLEGHSETLKLRGQVKQLSFEQMLESVGFVLRQLEEHVICSAAKAQQIFTHSVPLT